MLLKCPNLCGENVYLQLDSFKKYGLMIESVDLEAVSKRYIRSKNCPIYWSVYTGVYILECIYWSGISYVII